MPPHESRKRSVGSNETSDSQRHGIAAEELAAFATHEFRGPVHTLQAFLSILLEEQSGPLNEIQRDFISSMFFIVRRLERLTEDIQVILSEGDGFSIDLRPVDILALIEDCLREITPVADGFGVKVEISADGDAKWETQSDPVRFAQITINLLENAVRNAVHESTVNLRLLQSTSRLLLVVENESDSPPSKNIEEWFTPFFRGESAKERSPKGLGLGLPIVNHLVTALEGRIVTRVVDRTVTIGICLPKRVAANVHP
jgi:signal transduction histidine kinase